MSGGPITLFTPAEMRQSATERGTVGLLVGDAEEKALRKDAAARMRKEAPAATMPPPSTRWIPQPVSFAKLKSYQDPFHCRAVRMKARLTAGLGFLEDPAKGELPLPKSSRGDSFKQQLVLAAIDAEHTGNGYLEIVMAAGATIASMTWLQAETMEISEDQQWYRHTATTPGTAHRRVTYYEAWPRTEAPKGGRRYCLHVTHDGTWSTWYGEPDWLGVLPDLMLSDGYTRYNRAKLDNNCIPTWLILLLGAKLDDDKPEDPNNAGHYLQSAREKFVAWMGGIFGGVDNAGKAMLLDNIDITSEKADVKFQNLQVAPAEGEYLKARDQCRDRIISGEGVPPRLLGVVASGSLGGSGEFYGQLLAFKLELAPKKETWDGALAMIQPYLPGIASLTLKEMDIEPWRNTGGQSPSLPPDSSAAKIAGEVDAILRQAGVR